MGEKYQQNWFMMLREGFWKSHPLDIIRGQHKELAREVFALYVTMLNDSLSYGGRLRFSENKPYSAKTLAGKYITPEDIIVKCLDILQEYDLITIDDDGTIVMEKFSDYVRSKSPEAERRAKYRKMKKNCEESDSDDEYESDDDCCDVSQTCRDTVVTRRDTSQTCRDNGVTSRDNVTDCHKVSGQCHGNKINIYNNNNIKKEEVKEETASPSLSPGDGVDENPACPVSPASERAVTFAQIDLYVQNVNDKKKSGGRPTITDEEVDGFKDWLSDKNFFHKGVVTIERLGATFSAWLKFRRRDARNEAAKEKELALLKQADEATRAKSQQNSDKVSSYMLRESQWD